MPHGSAKPVEDFKATVKSGALLDQQNLFIAFPLFTLTFPGQRF
jgi:hypothetical protein